MSGPARRLLPPVLLPLAAALSLALVAAALWDHFRAKPPVALPSGMVGSVPEMEGPRPAVSLGGEEPASPAPARAPTAPRGRPIEPAAEGALPEEGAGAELLRSARNEALYRGLEAARRRAEVSRALPPDPVAERARAVLAAAGVSEAAPPRLRGRAPALLSAPASSAPARGLSDGP